MTSIAAVLFSLVLFATPVLANAACTNFTGDWAGTCRTEGVDTPQDDAFSVVQMGCESILRGNEKFVFGVPSTVTEELESHDEKITVAADWNAAKTDYHVTYDVVGTAKGSSQVLFTQRGTLTDSLQAGVLTSVQTTESTDSGGTAQSQKIICTYRKAGE